MDSYAEEQFNEQDQPSNSGLLRFRSAPSPAPLLSSFKPQSPPVVDSPHNQLPPFRVDASNSTPPAPMDVKLGGCLLTGQTSSPAAFFSNLTSINDGYGMMGGGGSFRLASSSASGEDHSNRMKAHVNLGTSIGHLPRIPEIGAETTNDSGSDDGGGTHSHRYTSAEEDPRFHNHGYSWNDNTSGLKRHQQDNRILYSGLGTSASQNGMLPHRTHILSHHLSLPKTSAEMAAVEKLLNFQETVPCKIRAKRGYATHPRSIAERVRRTRISERMKQLQDLVPNMEKQVNTSEMLDLAVDYIKELQKQYKTLSDNRARCKCLPVQQ